MGKITPNGYVPPVDDDEKELSDTQPGIVRDEDDEEDVPGITPEGQPVNPPAKEEDDDEGGEAEEDKPITFKSQKDLDAFVAEQAKRNQPAAPTTPAAPAAPATTTPAEEKDELADLVFWKGSIDPETGKWVGEAPKDWNDLARQVIKYVTSEKQKQAVVEYIRTMSSKQKEEMEKIDQEFDQEFDELASQGLVPKRGTKEGDEVNEKISVIGGTYNLTSMKAAYELAKKIPASEGGLLDYKPTTEKKPNPSKQASRLIGSSTKTNAATKGKVKMSYAKLHSARGVDDLIDEDN